MTPSKGWVWSLNGRQATAENTTAVRGEVLAVSPDGRLLLTASADGQVRIWKVGETEPVRLWWFPGRVYGAAFAQDGRHLALGNANGTIYILRLPDEAPAPAQSRPSLVDMVFNGSNSAR